MASTVTLDITGYTDLRQQPPTITGRRIKLLVFLTINGQATNTFKEYTGVLAEVTGAFVRFNHVPSLFYREVNLGETVIPLKEYYDSFVHIDPLRTYMWQNIDGSDNDSAIVVSSPTRGGKSKRKRKKTRRLPRKKRVA